MKVPALSLHRRCLMIGGAAAVVIPAGWLHATRAGAAIAAPPGGQHKLILAGRVTDAAGHPLAGVTVNAWPFSSRMGGDDTVATASDADGRFVICTAAESHAADTKPLHVRLIHPAHDKASKEYVAVTFEPAPRQAGHGAHARTLHHPSVLRVVTRTG